MSRLPQSKSGQLAELLRERIASGIWVGTLPAERELAGEFMVSRTTLRHALTMLQREGLVGGATSTRRGRAIKKRRASPARKSETQVMVLTPTLSGAPVLLEQLGDLRERLAPTGLRVHVHEACGLVDRKSPAAELRRIAARHPDAVWVLNRMPRAIQQAVANEGWAAVVFGSVFPGIALPAIDIDFRSVARHAAGLCLARGCKRLALLVSRTMLAGDDLAVEAVTVTLARHNAPPPLILRHDFNRARLMDRLDREIVGRRGEYDALIVANQHHLLTALSHLQRRGIRIPQDLAVLCLSNDPMMERLSPLPCRYDSGTALTRRLAAAIKSLANGESPASGLLIPRLLEGETLPDPPRIGSKKGQSG